MISKVFLDHENNFFSQKVRTILVTKYKCWNICVCDRFILLVYTYRISQRFYWIDFAPKRFKSNKYPTCTKLLRNSSWFAKKSEYKQIIYECFDLILFFHILIFAWNRVIRCISCAIFFQLLLTVFPYLHLNDDSKVS